MSNLVLTTDCNRACAYCFADAGHAPAAMTVDEATKAMDLIVASGLSQVRFLGGEPTLHPEFAAIVQAALERGLEVLIFSNGLMPPAALASILETPPGRCHVLLNLNIGESRPTAEVAALDRVAAALGPRGSVGANLHRPGLPLHDALEFAQAHDLAPVLRLGLAHPRGDRRNTYLHPRHYSRVGAEITAFADELRQAGFELRLDCGFVPCMFSPDFLAEWGLTVADVGQRCGPIPDLLPEGTAIACLPLGALNQLPVSGARSVHELRERLAEHSAYLAPVGVYRECDTCNLRLRGECGGGCRSTAFLRTQRSAHAGPVPRPAATKPATASAAPWALPYVDQPLDFWSNLAADCGPRIREIYFPLDVPGVGTGRPAQPGAHLVALRQAPPVPLAVLVNPLVLPRPLAELAPAILDRLAFLHEVEGVATATVSDVRLAELIRQRLPGMSLTASCLLEVTEPEQAERLSGLFDVLVPATRLLRHPERLAAVRQAFAGRLRLLVNEGCLDSCLERRQHFYEMAQPGAAPASLCADRLREHPWRQLTGAWVLPQHLYLLADRADEFKLAGRVSLRQAAHYRKVVAAYLGGRALWPHEIGGGPASVTEPCSWSAALAEHVMTCSHRCNTCGVCARAWGAGGVP